MDRRQIIKAIGAAIIAGNTPYFIKSLISSESRVFTETILRFNAEDSQGDIFTASSVRISNRIPVRSSFFDGEIIGEAVFNKKTSNGIEATITMDKPISDEMMKILQPCIGGHVRHRDFSGKITDCHIGEIVLAPDNCDKGIKTLSEFS